MARQHTALCCNFCFDFPARRAGRWSRSCRKCGTTGSLSYKLAESKVRAPIGLKNRVDEIRAYVGRITRRVTEYGS